MIQMGDIKIQSIHPSIHTYIHPSIHPYIHTFLCFPSCSCGLWLSFSTTYSGRIPLLNTQVFPFDVIMYEYFQGHFVLKCLHSLTYFFRWHIWGAFSGHLLLPPNGPLKPSLFLLSLRQTLYNLSEL